MRIQAPPFLLRDPNDPGSATAAKALRLSNQLNDDFYDEHWLQMLINANPELIPATDLEPAWRDLAAVCTELPCPAGYVDNVFVTPQGYLAFVECKLWRNTEARRKVIAQILDYAKDIAGWEYDDLAHAINTANKTNFENPLYRVVREHPEASDETTFVDRVSRNLRMGRHLLLIIGDGIQENLVSLTEHLQKHIGLHFTLALVEVGIFNLGHESGLVIVPNIVARTLVVERGVIRIEGGSATIDEPVTTEKSSLRSKGRPQPLSEQEFFSELSASTPAGAKWLRDVLSRLETLDVTYDIKRSLIMRFSPDGEQSFGLGYVETSGRFQTAHSTWETGRLGRVDIARHYLEAIAQMVEGAYIPEHENPGEWSVKVDNRTLSINDLIGKEAAYLKIAADFVSDLRALMDRS